jgi:two-component system, OmpR family, response regulator MprA
MRDQLCILIADDERAIVDVVVNILQDEGYLVLCVYDGASALRATQVQAPDLVILDNMMPMMTGVEVLRELRAQGFQRPIIIMSAIDQAHLFMHDGATAFLAKPFTLGALLETVAWQLGHS